MSDFTPEELAGLGEQLEQMRSDLRSEIRDELLRVDAERYSELADKVHEPGEESVVESLAEINVSVVRTHILELREVEAALGRLAEGHYGYCCDCDEPIPFARLQAYPQATRCITHQAAWEAQHKE